MELRKDIGLVSLWRWGVGFACAVGLSACMASSPSGTDRWREEVLLHDGQKVIVQRSQIYGGRSEIGQPPPVREHTIKFPLPNSRKLISWTSEFDEELGRTNFTLLALHVKQGIPYLVVKPTLCLSYNKWGRPNPPDVFFRYGGKDWQRISIAEVPPEFRSINLILDTTEPSEMRAASKISGFVPGEAIAQLNTDLRQPELRAIVREPIRYDPDCIPMISNGLGLWRSASWFESKPTLDACLSACRADNFDNKHCPCSGLFQRKR